MLSISSDPQNERGRTMGGGGGGDEAISPMSLDPLQPPQHSTTTPENTQNNNTASKPPSRLTSRLPRLEQYKVRLSTQMRDEQELNTTHLRELVDFFVLSLDSYTHALYLSICEDYKLGTLSRAGAASMVFSLMQQHEGSGTSNNASTSASLSATMNSMTHTRMEERSTRELFDFLNGPLLQDLRREKQVGRSGDAAMLDSDENTSDDDVIASPVRSSLASPRRSNLSTREDIRLRAQRSMEDLKRSNNTSTLSMSSSLAPPLAATLSGGGGHTTPVPVTKAPPPARRLSRSITTTVDPNTPISPIGIEYPVNQLSKARRVGAGVDMDCFKTTAVMWRRVRRQLAPSFNLRLKGLLNVAATIRFGGAQTTNTNTKVSTPRRSKNRIVRHHVDPLSANSSFPLQPITSRSNTSSNNHLYSTPFLQNSGIPTVSDDEDEDEGRGVMHDGLGSVDITMTPPEEDISLSRTGSHFDLDMGGTHRYDADEGDFGSIDDGGGVSDESGGGGARDVALSMAAVTTTLTSTQLRASLMSRLRAAELRLKGMRLRNSQIKMSLNQARDEDMLREMADKRRQDKRLKMLEEMLDEAVRLKDAVKSEVALSTRNGQYFVMHTMPLKKLFQEVEGYNAALQGLDAPDEQLILPWLEKWKRDGVLPPTAPSPDGGEDGGVGGASGHTKMGSDNIQLPPRTLSISDLVTTKIHELREESARIEGVLKTCVDGVLQHTTTILDEDDPNRIPTHIAPNICQEYASDYVQVEVDKAWRDGAVTTSGEEKEYRRQLGRDLSPERINWESVVEAGYAARPSNKTAQPTQRSDVVSADSQFGAASSFPSSSSDVLQRIRRLYALDPSLAEAEVSRLERQSSSPLSQRLADHQHQQHSSPVNRRLYNNNTTTTTTATPRGGVSSSKSNSSTISDLNLFSPTLQPPTVPVSTKAVNPSASSSENQARQHSLVMGHSGAVSQRLADLKRKMGSLTSSTTTTPPPLNNNTATATTRRPLFSSVMADRSSSSISTGDPYFEPTTTTTPTTTPNAAASTNIAVTDNSSIFATPAAAAAAARSSTPHHYQQPYLPAYLSKMSLPTPQQQPQCHDQAKRGPFSDVFSSTSSAQPDAMDSVTGTDRSSATMIPDAYNTTKASTTQRVVPTPTTTASHRPAATPPAPTTTTSTSAAPSQGAARAPITNALLEQYLASRQQVHSTTNPPSPHQNKSSTRPTTTATTLQPFNHSGAAVVRRGSTDSVERKLHHLRAQRQGGSQY